MNRELMKVNPRDLIVDMPVDEAKVQEYVMLTRKIGVACCLPVIWLQDLRIIDGFHRVTAIQLLALQEIECVVVDCSEEEFWDLRIIASREHAKISKDRLAIWMRESFRNSNLYKKYSADTQDDEFGALAKILYEEYYRDRRGVTKSSRIHRDIELEGWIAEKARRWGVQEIDIVEKFLSWYGLDIFSGNAAVIESVARDLSLPLDKRQILQREIKSSNEPVSNWHLYKSTMSEWAKSELQKPVPARPYAEFARERNAPKPIKNSEMLDRELDIFTSRLERLTISDVPEAPRRLYALVDAIENKIAEFFPDHIKKGKGNPILKENNELYERIKEMERKIESLTRALNSKNAVSVSSMALSNSEIERMV